MTRVEMEAYGVRARLHHRRVFRAGWARFRRERLGRVPIAFDDVTLRSLPGFEHIEVRWRVGADERFVGFGEHANAVDQRGWRPDHWTDEGAWGFGERLSPLLTRLGVSWNPFPKGATATHKPVSWFISSAGYAVYLRTHAPIFWDVCASDPAVLTAEVAAREVDVLVLHDEQPAVLLERLCELTGSRPTSLPDWTLAPWNDAVGGEDEVRRVAAVLRRERIPSGAVWYEDWQGARWFPSRLLGKRASWHIFPVRRDPDVALYPDVRALNDDLHAQGFKALGYAYPYVARDDRDFERAERGNWLLRDRSGRRPAFVNLWGDQGQVDLTHPDGRAWFRGELERQRDLGFDGWMADFGEYTPIDSRAHDGEDGLRHHNRFPLLWAELNREVVPDDGVFFMRGATTGQQASCPVFFPGDFDTNFERWDGLPAAVRALISAGLSGLPITACDVGGYFSFLVQGRDAETLARWAEWTAFTPVMRTHHGTHPRKTVQFDHDRRTLDHYARYARMHAALFPTFRGLVDEAIATGMPPCRALLLHHPGDDRAWSVEDEFLLGRDLLVAPVVERGAQGRRVYLPAGVDWIDVWRGTRHRGGTDVEVSAPLGTVPLFLRTDGALATFDLAADTYARRSTGVNAGLRTLDDVEHSIAVLTGPDADDHAGDAVALERDAPHELLPADLLGAWRPAAAAHHDGRRVVTWRTRASR